MSAMNYDALSCFTIRFTIGGSWLVLQFKYNYRFVSQGKMGFTTRANMICLFLCQIAFFGTFSIES